MGRIIGILIAVAAVIALGSVYIVRENEQAIVLQFGNPVKVVNTADSNEPGLYFKRPFIFESVLKLEKRVLDLNAEPREVIAADQKRLIIDSFAKYKIVDPLEFYETVRDERGARLRLNAILDSSLREVVGKEPLAALLTGKRSEIMERAREAVNSEAASFGIEVVDVRIMRADLPQENSQKIYRRMQTEREREAKEFRAQGNEEAQRIKSRADKDRTVLLATAKQQAEILRGEGEAEATRIFADAFGRDEAFYSFYRTLAAYRETIASDDTTMVLSPDSDFLQLLRNSEMTQ